MTLTGKKKNKKQDLDIFIVILDKNMRSKWYIEETTYPDRCHHVERLLECDTPAHFEPNGLTRKLKLS